MNHDPAILAARIGLLGLIAYALITSFATMLQPLAATYPLGTFLLFLLLAGVVVIAAGWLYRQWVQ